MTEQEIRDAIRQLVDWRQNRIRMLQEAIRDVNEQYDRRIIELQRQLPKPQPTPEAPPQRGPRKAPPAPDMLAGINKWNREHGLPEIDS
jgi:hypothetical protein